MSILLITHNLCIVGDIADRVAVKYAGRIVESAPVHELFSAPAHPYTAALLASVPRLDTPATQRLSGIGGQPPRTGEADAGCAFAPRCPRAVDVCRAVPPVLHSSRGRSVSCRKNTCLRSLPVI